MSLRLLFVSAALALALGAPNVTADPTKIGAPFGFLERNGTCPDATHILRYPCPGVPGDYYLVFNKARLADLTLFEGMNVAIQGKLVESVCPRPLIEVNKISVSAVLPPCPEPARSGADASSGVAAQP